MSTTPDTPAASAADHPGEPDRPDRREIPVVTVEEIHRHLLTAPAPY
jgi:hypothetical protein